jgi:hypothetical protein
LGNIIGEKGYRFIKRRFMPSLIGPLPKHLQNSKDSLASAAIIGNLFKGFSQLCTPLTDLTRKGEFAWSGEAQSTFEKMKKVMSTCPVLSLPDFSQPFILECDAFSEGVGACSHAK